MHDSRRDIGITDHGIAGARFAGPVDDEGHIYQLGVHLVIVRKPAVLAELITVVVGDNEHRVVQNPQIFQVTQEFLKVGIHLPSVDIIELP
ncbi:hypothetical protein ES703_58910 [subsurface metagenome]